LGWFVLFALQHSGMARRRFKERWLRLVPEGTERSAFVLASSLMMGLLFLVWRPIPIVLYRVDESVLRGLIIGVSYVGWGLALMSTFAIDHFELFGLRQALRASRGQTTPSPVFATPLLYRFVRHPLYLGFAIAFWFTPTMTVGHLLFACGMTLYILIGMRFEERDLVRTFGDEYVRYRRRVPSLIPWPRPGMGEITPTDTMAAQ
jgi:protein-S-isoprenylcysteine O-methyltransferase Ste14